MDDSFLRSLQQLKKADPNRAIEVIFKMFNSIGTMNVPEVAAAKQTLDLFRSLTALDETGGKAIDAMQEALIVRARILRSLAGFGTQYDYQTRIAFSNVFRDYYADRIDKW